MTSKNINKKNYQDDNEISKLIKLVVVVTVVFLVFYLITYLVNREKTESETENNTATIQYDEILIGNLLEQPNDEYYVMIYDIDDYQSIVYETYLNLYSNKDDALRYYTATLNNPLNKNFVSDKSNFEIKKITDLKINGSSLIKIKNKKIEKYYVGEDIISYLKEISKEAEN